MLLSLQLNSNRPDLIKKLIDNIEETSSNPSDIEILINIDEGDNACLEAIKSLQTTTKTQLRFIQTNIIKSYQDLWKPLNELLKHTDPKAYFVTNFSDEFRFKTKGWDDVIRKYVGYYDDGIFRIRLSKYRYYSYRDSWECVFAPDSLAFYSKKWLDTVGMWCPCLGPDSWQQLVAYYLINARKFSHLQYNRDIPEPFIEVGGEGAGNHLSAPNLRKRMKDNLGLWFETVSHEMQERAKYAATKLQSQIIIHQSRTESIGDNLINAGKPNVFQKIPTDQITIKDNLAEKVVEFHYNKKVIYKISYKLNKIKIFLTNNWRKLNYNYYILGSGPECLKKNFLKRCSVYFAIKKTGTDRMFINNYNLKKMSAVETFINHLVTQVINIKKPEWIKGSKYKILWPAIKIFLLIKIFATAPFIIFYRLLNKNS